MEAFKRIRNIAGWSVFAVAFIVYFFTVERTGSLWDCGEFITGAYKLEVVHPPGASLFLLMGRMFTIVAELFSSDPSAIAFSVNLFSGISTAFAAMLVCWVTIILGKLALVGREDTPNSSEQIALAGAGVVAGLATAFSTSIWFSAVEGEVYALSTFFTTLTLWAMMRWYELPDKPETDRWIIFAIYSAGLSIGVHLLSLLTFPALALFYYFKKTKEPNFKGVMIAGAAGVAVMVFIQTFIIVGIPTLWTKLEILTVNGFGLPINSGLIPLILIIGGLIFLGLKMAQARKHQLLEIITVSALLLVVSFSTLGIVVIRAKANTPINMNAPSDAMRLLPYLNREQYGERPLLKGPSFNIPQDGIKYDREERYGIVGDKYEIVDEKISYNYDSKYEMLFPRMGHLDDARKPLYKMWLDIPQDSNVPSNRPTMGDNLGFFFKYQVSWMYYRYFMWNFAGRQNGEQGVFPWDYRSGNWLSGIGFYDSWRLGNQSELPATIANNKARNKYYLLPFLFGLIGLFFHAKKRGADFLGLLALFIITGIGIIVYSNQPPQEPRERDYVLAGSIFTYCIWIGMGVLGIFQLLRTKISPSAAAPVAVALVALAPLLMGVQNFDDHNRRHHTGSRDYASNFLNSCKPNAIIFTYGDNDTYPLWYAQEVENIRTDVRVVNLSLIAVDWYINQLRRRVNDSAPIKMTLTPESIRGKLRNQLYIDPYNKGQLMSLKDAIRFVKEDNPIANGQLKSYMPTRKLFIPFGPEERKKAAANGIIDPSNPNLVNRIDFGLGKSGSFLFKGDVAVLDIVANNLYERPIYFAVTCRPESMLGLGAFTQLTGLAREIVPIKSAGEANRYGTMLGSGRVAVDEVYDNVMNKFRWGGFDKKDLFVDRSYGPTVQTTQVAISRTISTMIDQGDTQRAEQLLDKYFEAFPHMNFPYDNSTMLYINDYVRLGKMDKAKTHLTILANELSEYLNYYTSLDPDDLAKGFGRDYAQTMAAKDRVLALVTQMKDPGFETELKEMFAPYAKQ